MDTLVTLTNPEESNQIASGLSEIFPLLAISAGTVSLILVIYFVVMIILKISNNKRTIKMQNDIRIMREILEKNNGIITPLPEAKPQIKLADGALHQKEEQDYTA